MTFYAGTIGELLIVEAFVFFIWVRVMLDAIAVKDGSLAHKKLLLTSIGLVLSSLAVFSIMTLRIYELEIVGYPTGPSSPFLITTYYALLGASGFMFLVSATLGKPARLIRWFFLASVVWTLYCIGVIYFQKG